MTSTIATVIGLALLLGVSSPSQGETIVGAGSQAASPEHQSLTAPRDLIAVWSQQPDLAEGGWHASFLRLSDGQGAECADDIQLPYTATITAIEWWGAYGPPADLQYLLLRIYQDGGSGTPGSLHSQKSIYTFTGEQVAGGSGSDYRYSADLDSHFTPVAGTTYWLSIWGVEQTGEWFWYECIPGDHWGNEAAFRSDYLGYSDWVPWSDYGSGHAEFAFVLYADPTTVEPTTWGTIKALYR